MPDPLDPGAGLNSGNSDSQKLNDLMSQYQQLVSSLNASVGSADALQAVLNRVHDVIATLINPALAEMGKLPSAAAKQFKIYESDLKNITSVHKKYYEMISTEEQRRLTRIRENLQQELILTKLHYQAVIKIAQDADSKRQLGKEYAEARAKQKSLAYAEETGGAPSGAIASILKIPEAIEGMTASLGGLFAFGELLNMAITGAQSQYRAGGALARTSGQGITVGAGLGVMTSMLGDTATSFLGVETAASLLNDALGKAPQLARQNLEPAIGSMAHFGVTVQDAVKMITDASARAGTTAKQFNENWGVAVGLIDKFKKSGVDMVWTINRMTDFSAALVQTGVSSDTANQQAQVFASSLLAMQSHLKLTTAQMEPFVQSLGGVMAGMTPEKAIGLLSLPGMGGLPNINNPKLMDELSARTGNMDFFTKMRGSFGHMGIPAGLQDMSMMRALGMQGTILQTKAFAEFMKDLTPSMDITKEMQKRGLASDSDNIASIAKTTIANESVMKLLYNFLQFWTQKLETPLQDAIFQYLGTSKPTQLNSPMAQDAAAAAFNRGKIRQASHILNAASRNELS
jgi:hypothetical protein